MIPLILESLLYIISGSWILIKVLIAHLLIIYSDGFACPTECYNTEGSIGNIETPCEFIGLVIFVVFLYTA